jgi:hypothetical protein
MRKLVVLLLVSLAIPIRASDTYVYPPGLDSAIQHWQYPNTTAMSTDFGFYAQDIGKIAFNVGNGTYYYLSNTAPTWTPMATGGGGGSTTFIGLLDVPSSYTGSGGKLVAVNSGATALEFVTAAGGGNVTNVGTPAAEENAVWTDPTHIKGTRTLGGGSNTFVLTKLSNTDYDYGWIAPTGGGGAVSITATTPIVVTPSPLTGTGVISLDPASDLAALEALTGGNTIYYRSGTNAWSPVIIGNNLTFVAGTLAASVTGGGGGTVTSITATSPIQVSPNPITATGTVSIESGSDLAALEALTGTNNIYYRSGVSTWSNVGIGSNLTFIAGALAAGNANWDTAFTERRQWDGSSTNLNATLGRSSLGATTIGANVFTLANPVATSFPKITSTGVVTLEDAATHKTSLGLNTTNWDTAYTDRMKWDTSLGISGGTTGQGRTALGATTAGGSLFTLANPASTSWIKVGSTGTITLEDAATTKSSLSLNNVTNDAQTKASVMPNTAPLAGYLPIGNAGGTAYVPTSIQGNGSHIDLTSTGVMTVNAITNAAIANPQITVAGNVTALGGSVSRDQVTGLTGVTGLIKQTAANTLAAAVAGTDYKVGSTNTINIRMVTATGTFTPTAGITALYIEGVGGGGGGGGVTVTTSGNASCGGGGGGGGYAAVYIGTPAASYSITIGAGGAAGVSTGGGGSQGGTTTVGANLTATGGIGGAGGSTTGCTCGLVWAAGGTGGAGTVGTTLLTGSDGGWAISLAAGQALSGSGGASFFGGVSGSVSGTTTGTTGNLYGGGGSGGSVVSNTGRAGGAGAAGVVRVWEIF